MWMHNGNLGCWKHIKRKLAASVGDEWFINVQGSTDSEWAFALFLDSMDRLGWSPNMEVGSKGFGHTVLRKAILRTIERINELIKDVPKGQSEEDSRSLLNFAVTDGYSVVCTRYVSSATDEAASLFFSSGTSWQQQQPPDSSHSLGIGEKDYKMERRDKGADIVLVASEPLTFERDNWVTVPTNSTLTICGQTVMIHPIIDEFYSTNPAHQRSSNFARTKGQTITGPDKRVLPTETNGENLNGNASPEPKA
jgi:glutamine amidotransferase